eukprot:3487776-Prymnesium_polylepis.2
MSVWRGAHLSRRSRWSSSRRAPPGTRGSGSASARRRAPSGSIPRTSHTEASAACAWTRGASWLARVGSGGQSGRIVGGEKSRPRRTRAVAWVRGMGRRSRDEPGEVVDLGLAEGRGRAGDPIVGRIRALRAVVLEAPHEVERGRRERLGLVAAVEVREPRRWVDAVAHQRHDARL